MPLKTPHYYEQGAAESLADLPRPGGGPKRIRITHILQPYDAKGGTHQKIQDLTFETMRIAMRAAAGRVQVRPVCVPLKGEESVVPPDFLSAAPLSRTIRDIATFGIPRAHPLVFDILDNGIALPESPPEEPGCEDYIILTNADIHLLPHFYLAIAELIAAGYDVMTVNRRTIPNFTPEVSELPWMFSEYGQDHAGVDCFVFPRRIYPSFVRNDACVGMASVMRGLVFNLAANAQKYLVLTRAHLTFHVGNDMGWRNHLYTDYYHFNTEESLKVVRAIAADKDKARDFVAFLSIIGSPPDYIWAAMDTAGISRLARGQFARPPRARLRDLIRTPAGRKRILNRILITPRHLAQKFLFPLWRPLPEGPKRLVRKAFLRRRAR